MTTVVADIVRGMVYSDTKLTLDNGTASCIVKTFGVEHRNLTLKPKDKVYKVLCFAISGRISPSIYSAINNVKDVELSEWFKGNLRIAPASAGSAHQFTGICVDDEGTAYTFEIRSTAKVYSDIAVYETPLANGSGGNHLKALMLLFDLNPRDALMMVIHLGLDVNTGGMLCEANSTDNIVRVIQMCNLEENVKKLKEHIHSLFEPDGDL